MSFRNIANRSAQGAKKGAGFANVARNAAKATRPQRKTGKQSIPANHPTLGSSRHGGPSGFRQSRGMR